MRRDRATLTVLDVHTGKIRWSVPLRFAGAAASPTLVGDRVLVSGYLTTNGSGSEPCGMPVFDAFDAAHGAARWHGSGGLVGASSDRYVITGGTRPGTARVLDPRTGRAVLARLNGGASVILGDVAIGEIPAHGLYAHDLRTGRLLWQTGKVVPGYANTAVDDRTMYVLGPPYAPPYKKESPPTYLTAVDARSGKIHWRALAPTRSALVVRAGDTLVATPYSPGTASDTPGEFRAYNAASGRLLWHRPSHSVDGAVARGGTVYALRSDRKIVTIDARSGAMRDAPKPSQVDGLLGVSGNVLVGALPDGVEAIDPSNGRVLWSRTTRQASVGLPYTYSAVAGDAVYSVTGFDCLAGD